MNKNLESMKENIIVIKTEAKIYRIRKEEVFSVAVASGIATFLLEDGCKIEKSMTLKSALELLPDFVKVNRNCIINSDKIKSICKKTRTVTMVNNEEYKVSFREIAKVCFTLN